jgi:rhomboid family GlyGly-CTERM serine protease
MKTGYLKQVFSRLPVLTLSVGSGALIMQLCSPSFNQLLEYNRILITGSEFWRILSGHLTHWSFNHFIWDWLTFIFLASFYEIFSEDPRKRIVLSLSLLISAVFISASVFVFLPDMILYRGLSGLCVTAFTLVSASMLFEALEKEDYQLAVLSGAALAGLTAKITYETATGNTLFVESQNELFHVVPLAHLVGALSAFAVIACRNYRMSSKFGSNRCILNAFQT